MKVPSKRKREEGKGKTSKKPRTNKEAPSTSTAAQTSEPQENTDTPSRRRHQSGELTLEELQASLVFKSSPSSVSTLRSRASSEDILKLLFTWERQSVRQQIRYSFHQGYYITLICNSRDISLRGLAKESDISFR